MAQHTQNLQELFQGLLDDFYMYFLLPHGSAVISSALAYQVVFFLSVVFNSSQVTILGVAHAAVLGGQPAQ